MNRSDAGFAVLVRLGEGWGRFSAIVSRMWLVLHLGSWVATGAEAVPNQAESARSGVLLFIVVALLLLILVVIAALLIGRRIARTRTEAEFNEETDPLPDPWIEAARRVQPFGSDAEAQ